MPSVQVICRLLVAGVFLVSLVSKLRGRDAAAAFTASVSALRIVPDRWGTLTAAAIVLSEAAVVGLLALPGTLGIGFVLAAAVLTVLTCGIALELQRGSAPPCRCFGPSSTPLGPVHIGRNLALLAAVVAGGLAPAPPPSTPSALVANVLVAVAGGLLVVLCVEFTSLFADRPPSRSAALERRKSS